MDTFSALLAICAGNSPVPSEFPAKGQWRGALVFSLICALINSWQNNGEAGDLRRHPVHYDVNVMWALGGIGFRCVRQNKAKHVALAWASCQIRKIAGAHARGMPGTFSPSPQVSDFDMHHGTCVTHVPWCMAGSLTSGFLWKRRRGKLSRLSRRMRNLQFYVSGKRPIEAETKWPPFNKNVWILIRFFTVVCSQGSN